MPVAGINDTDPEVSITYNNIALSYWRQGKYQRALAYHQRALALVSSLLVMGFPMLRTLSRASFVGMLAGICLLGMVRKRSLLVALIIFLFIFPMLATHEMIFRYSTIPNALPEWLSSMLPGFEKGPPPGSWEAKLSAWEKYWPKILKEPLLGMGYGSVYMAVVDTEYLKILCETGFLGFLAFLWLMKKILEMAWRTSERAPEGFYRGFATGYLAGSVALFIHAIAAPSLSTIRTAEPFMFSTALVTLLYNRFVTESSGGRDAQRRHKRREDSESEDALDETVVA